MFSPHAADTVLPDAVCTNQSREIRRTFVFPQDPPDLNLQIQYGHPSICHAPMQMQPPQRTAWWYSRTYSPFARRLPCFYEHLPLKVFTVKKTRPKASPTNEAYKIAWYCRVSKLFHESCHNHLISPNNKLTKHAQPSIRSEIVIFPIPFGIHSRTNCRTSA